MSNHQQQQQQINESQTSLAHKKPHLKDLKAINKCQETSPTRKSFRSLSEVILNKIVISPTTSVEHSIGSIEQTPSTASFDKYKQVKITQISNNIKHNHELEKHLHTTRNHDHHSTNDQQDFLKKFSTRSFNQVDTTRRPSFMPCQFSEDSNHVNEQDESKLKCTKFYLPNDSSNCKSMSADNSSSNASNLHRQETNESRADESLNVKESKIIENILIRLNYFVISPDDNGLFIWLIILNLCFLYNIWLIIARQSFEKLQTGYSLYWKIFDTISDIVYLIDICVQFRTGYLEQGLLVYNSKKLALNYMKSKQFLLDLFSMTPLELLQYRYGYDIPMLRFPRFFKCYRFAQLCYIAESRTLYPNLLRVIFLTHILFLLGHWFAGFYFLISQAEGFKGHWSYPEPVEEFALLPRMYLRCLYWSTLTLTTIGDLPPPETNWQWLRDMSNSRYMFSIAVHYLAVFVIALIVGQVGNVIANRNASRVEFERLLDGAKQYMRNHNVPADMQKRVQRWYDYSWSRGRMTGAGDFHSIGLLPDKLKTELALHVNLETLRKVTIFQECQPEFLHDLVLKMRAYIFTPGDFICRKGEIAREMFIIADGVLEVLGNKGQVFTKMYSGDFFGEIGILNIEGASNKRTADVRSVGYAELFSLSKDDILSAVRDFPEAERILIEYGRRRLNKNQTKIVASPTVEQLKPITETAASLQIKKETLKEATLHEEEQKCTRTHSKKLKDISKLKELNTISEEINQRAAGNLTTDMLGIPTINSPKYQHSDEVLADYFASANQSANYFYKNQLQKILNKLNSSSSEDAGIDSVRKDIIELKDTIEKEKISRVNYLEELVVQKDAKIKQLDSKVKMLQAFITQKKFENV